MPTSQTRAKTKYPGVFFVETVSRATGRMERVYYIRYRKDGRLVEEKAGRQFQDDMTPARASAIRTQRIEKKELSNQERREEERARKDAEANRWTMIRLWEEYKEQRPGLKGIVSDENRFQNHLSPIFGQKTPGEIIQLDVDRFRLRLLKKRQPQTARNILELFRRLVNFGVRKGLCERPSWSVEMPRVDNQKTEDLTPEQLAALLEALDQSPNIQVAGLMKMALFTGMRRGELFKLQWQDVDFERGFIRIRDPKGGKEQSVPLNEPARRLLESHPRTDSPFVFPGRKGKRRTDIKRAANSIKKTAGLPMDFRAMHGLRHVYASILASSGQVDMYTLQKLLTHKSPQMSQRYAHLQDEALTKSAELAGKLIEGVKCSTGLAKVVNLDKGE